MKEVVVGVICKDNTYLLVKSKHHEQKLWYPPAGHRKNFESREECIVREYKEELYADIKVHSYITSFTNDKGETTYWYSCTLISSITINKHELETSNWFSKEEILELNDIYPATKKLFKEFIF